ncbi:AsmA family protein [Escherichia coli]|uniref:AsmA family protein n=1 Tax=Escherichia coli TaxID=562 RepID=UPI000BEA2B60|nr:AsmA family protein [Escherichia coli]EHQ8512874.1 AsmA family protein [Escherichia coli]
MSKAGKITAAISVAFLLLIVVAIILIATFDWNRLKPTINQKVSAELNRPFAIRGDLGVVWERQKQETGWRSWVPWPHVHAEDIILGNPPDIPEVTMVHLPRVEATLAPLALLPDTPPFETDGRLVAKIDTEKSSVFDYRGFNGRIGDSDIHGSLVYTTGKPRPKLEGDVESRQLRLADLGPLIGVDSGKGAEKSKRSEQKKGEKSVQPAGKVLPYDRFETDKWDVMDADVRFKGRRIEHGSSLPISDLSTHIILKNADLRLQPLKFGMAGGSIAANIHLEGDKKPMQGRADIQARRLKLKELMPDVELMQKTLGEMNGDAELRGSGNSVAALLGNSNGNLKLLMNDGLVSRNLMEIVGLNVGNYIVGAIFGDDEVRVNCAAANLDIANGVARPQIFAFDTENALINVTGTASFASEQLDLTIDPESKGIRIITLRSPLYVRGTFKNPQAGVKAGPLIARGAVAAALATLVTPAAALLALISPSEGEANQCRTILSQMKK